MCILHVSIVDIPHNVNPRGVQCTLSSDHILQIEAPLTLPSYESVSASASAPAAPPPATTTTTSTTTPVVQHYQQQQQQQQQHQLYQQQQQHDGKTKSYHTTTTVVTNGGARSGQKGTGLLHANDVDRNKTYKIAVDIGSDYKPEDISIKTVNRRLVVNARHEDKAPGKSSTREFSREFDLPEFVDPNMVTATVTDSGTLVIEAPLHAH
jgi:HSP20 family molecular chaperone IbpA